VSANEDDESLDDRKYSTTEMLWMAMMMMQVRLPHQWRHNSFKVSGGRPQTIAIMVA
jgi:hypothetical protein